MFPPQVSSVAAFDEVADDVDLAATVEASIRAEDLRRRMRELPQLHRVVLVWRFGLLGPPCARPEIERRLELSPGAAVTLERRALTALRAAYRRSGVDEA